MIGIRSLVDMIYVINLNEATDRYARFCQEMDQFGISPNMFTRFSAIKPNNGRTKSDRLLGNKLSHVECIKDSKENGYNRVLICEDDCAFAVSEPEKTQMLLQNVLSFINCEKWDLFYLGCRHKENPQLTGNANVVRIVKCWSIHCYLVNSNSYDKVIGVSDSNPEDPCDVLYWERIQKSGFCFAVSPRIAYQTEGYSYAQEKHTKLKSFLD